MRLDGLRAYVYGLSGLVNVVLLRFKDAESCMDRGIELAPSSAYNYGLRAYTRLCLDDLDGAIEDCSRKLQLAPSDAGTLALRAWAYYLLGNFEMVAADLERAIEIEPSRKWYHFDCLRLLDAYQEMGDHDKVIAFTVDLVNSNPKVKVERALLTELITRRARSYQYVGEYEKAIADYNLAISMSPQADLIDLLAERSKVYDKLRLDDLAEKDRATSAQLQAHRAQMSEWLPANPYQRLIAQLTDGFVVGCLGAFFLFIVANFVDIACGAQAASTALAMNQWQPLILLTFAVGFLDSLLVGSAFLLAASCSPLIVAKLSIAPFSPMLLSAPLSNPEFGLTLSLLVVIVINWLYHAIMESSPKESTLGKSIFKLRVTDADGARASFWRSTMRHVLKTIPAIIVLFSFASMSFVFAGDIGVIFKAVFALLSIFLLVLGAISMVSPGVHNSLSSCIVSDNHLYTPRFNLMTGPTQQDEV